MITFYSEEIMPQRSPEWRAWRKTVGTATAAATIMGEPLEYEGVPKTWNALRFDSVFGDDFQGNAATRHGAAMEDEALEQFEGLYGHNDLPSFRPCCLERPHSVGGGFRVGASLDGYRYNPFEERHNVVEIKCPVSKQRGKLWKAADKGEVLRPYYWQLIHQMMALDDYVEFHREGTAIRPPTTVYFLVYIDPEHLRVITLRSEDCREDMARLEAEWGSFFHGREQLGDMTRDPDFRDLEGLYIDSWDRKKVAEKEAAGARAEMLKCFGERYSGRSEEPRRILGDRLNITRTPSESVDWAKFAAANPGLDTTPFEQVTVSVDWEAFRAAHPGLDYESFTTRRDTWTVREKPKKEAAL